MGQIEHHLMHKYLLWCTPNGTPSKEYKKVYINWWITKGTNRTSYNAQIFVMKHTKWHTFQNDIKDSDEMINH